MDTMEDGKTKGGAISQEKCASSGLKQNADFVVELCVSCVYYVQSSCSSLRPA